MKVQSIQRNRTCKKVTVTLAKDRADIPDALIVGWAMAQANETPSSLFGWSVSRLAHDSLTAVVTLNTD